LTNDNTEMLHLGDGGDNLLPRSTSYTETQH